MNQRLEKEIFDFLTTQSVLQDERSNVRERLGLYDELTVQKCAEYFYNLALEDVRKEVEKIGEYGISEYNNGFYDACEKIIDFIDQQSK